MTTSATKTITTAAINKLSNKPADNDDSTATVSRCFDHKSTTEDRSQSHRPSIRGYRLPRNIFTRRVQRHEHRRGYVAGAFPKIRKVPAIGRSGHHTNLSAVPEGFSDRLVRDAFPTLAAEMKNNLDSLLGNFFGKTELVTSSQTTQSLPGCNVRTKKPETTSRRCKNWRNTLLLWKTRSCVG